MREPPSALQSSQRYRGAVEFERPIEGSGDVAGGSPLSRFIPQQALGRQPCLPGNASHGPLTVAATNIPATVVPPFTAVSLATPKRAEQERKCSQICSRPGVCSGIEQPAL